MYSSLFSEMDEAISRSEMDRVLRGDLADFADEDEEDLFVTDDVLQERLQAFEEYLSQQNILHEASEEEEERVEEVIVIHPKSSLMPTIFRLVLVMLTLEMTLRMFLFLIVS